MTPQAQFQLPIFFDIGATLIWAVTGAAVGVRLDRHRLDVRDPHVSGALQLANAGASASTGVNPASYFLNTLTLESQRPPVTSD
ncbi:MAG: hypothetical protein WB526_11465 [Candidatus Cybelea sp.]